MFWVEKSRTLFLYLVRLTDEITQQEIKASKLLCPKFQGFCPNIRQIKTFPDALAPPAPTQLVWG